MASAPSTASPAAASASTAAAAVSIARARADRIRPLLLALGAASLAVVVWASRKRRAVWALLPCGLLLVMSAGELTNYYYSAFLLVPLLSRERKSYEILSLAGAAVSALLLPWGRISASFDTRCYFQSWVFFLVALLVVVSTLKSRSVTADEVDRT